MSCKEKTILGEGVVEKKCSVCGEKTYIMIYDNKKEKK